MHLSYELPRIQVCDSAPAAVDADLIIIPIAQDQLSEAVAAFDESVGGELASAVNQSKRLEEKISSATTRLEMLLSQIPAEDDA